MQPVEVHVGRCAHPGDQAVADGPSLVADRAGPGCPPVRCLQRSAEAWGIRDGPTPVDPGRLGTKLDLVLWHARAHLPAVTLKVCCEHQALDLL